MKKCNCCHRKQPLTEFYVERKTGRIRSTCKSCFLKKYITPKKFNKKQYDRQRRIESYGITVAEYEDMFESQNGRCKICSCKETTRGYEGLLSIDHCHKTGNVRGLLCVKCNAALGMVNDDLRTLQNCLKYLVESKLRHR